MIADGAGHRDDEVLDVDVCIVGGGPAGLVLADALIGSSLRVLLLERGGMPGKPQGLGASDLEDDGSTFDPPLPVPPRLGGAANEWVVRMPWHGRGVRMIPLAACDFEARSWVPNSGWPISRADLDPWYAEAHRLLGIGAFDPPVESMATDVHQPLPLEPHGFTTKIERFCDPAVITGEITARLAAADNVQVLLNASGGMLRDNGERITQIEIDAGRRARLSARADLFVLAGGGLENAGMLLRARDGAGVGNDADNVGRYFIDHARTLIGHVEPGSQRPVSSYGLYDFRRHGDEFIGGKLAVTPDAQAEHELLGSALQLLPKPPGQVAAALTDTREFVGRLRRGRPTRPPIRSLARSVAYVARLAPEMSLRQRRVPPRTDAGWVTTKGVDRNYDRFEVDLQTELAPDPSNRITLSPDRVDEMGRPRQRIRWRWTDTDVRSIHETRTLLGRAVSNAGLGGFHPLPWGEGMPELVMGCGAFHPSGTTRMSASAASGVVDASGRLHGEPSVAVLGSSVFPTNGYVNPTLTIVALALRMAEDIRNSALRGQARGPAASTSADAMTSAFRRPS